MVREIVFVSTLLGLGCGAVLAEGPVANVKLSHRAAKIYKGSDGQKITVVFLEKNERGDVLVKFEGVDGPWDGKVILHKRVVRDDPAHEEDFTTLIGDETWDSIQVRGVINGADGLLHPRMDVCVKKDPPQAGCNEFPVVYSEADSKTANVKEIVQEFEVSLGIFKQDGELKKASKEKIEQGNAEAIRLYTAGKKKEALLAWQNLLAYDPLNDNVRENIRTTKAELMLSE